MRSHSVQIFSTTGVRVRRSAASSLVIMSACWLLIRSVEDQFSPSRKGGIPVWAISCSRIIRTGAWQSGPRNLATFENGLRQEFELAYARGANLKADLRVFFKTFSVMFGKNKTGR